MSAGCSRENPQLATVFEEDTDIVGPMALHLWVEAKGADDMDLTVRVEKLSVTGEPIVMPDGPFAAGGVLRVSHRAVDESRFAVGEPYLVHTTEDKLQPGDVLAVDIPIAPIGLRFQPGDDVQTVELGGPPDPPARHGPLGLAPSVNRGTHVVHAGGERVQLPLATGRPTLSGTEFSALLHEMGIGANVDRLI